MQQQKLCLKWNNHTINLLSELETYQQKDVLVDVTISCEGRNIKAHKMVLSACSPYFQNIFSENPCQHPIVIINGMKYEDITSILNFMYKGEVNVSHDGLSSFLQAAEALKVKGLAEVCGEKKSSSSNSQENEPVEQARPQRTDTPTKKRHRNRKRSFSDSNRSDDEGAAAPRKHKEPNSPEVHELSGDESYTGDMSSNGQPMNSRVPQNMYSRSHQSSNVISHVDDMEDEFEIEPSKLLEQTLTTENVSMNNSASSDNSLRIERIMGNATEMESSSLQEPESPPDIKPIIDFGESSAGPSEGSMLVYNEQSQPGPSNVQDSSLLHDNSHTQVPGFQIRVLRELCLIKKNQKVIMEAAISLVNGQKTEVVKPKLEKEDCSDLISDVVKVFPISTTYEMNLVEDALLNKETSLAMVKWLSHIGGINLETGIKNILKRVVTNEMASHYSFFGARGKKEFRRLNLYTAILETIKISSWDYTEDQAMKIVINWLRHAKTRHEHNIKRETFILNEKQLKLSRYHVKPGSLGDSMFVKNLACLLFGERVLAISSVTGAKCNAKKNAVAKPALCPEKMAYIKELVQERIFEENPTCTVKELHKRTSKINAYIAEKIITLIRKK